MNNATASANVVLLPKQLRAEWVDALAVDLNLSHAAFRTACIIGSHVNHESGETFLKQETIARMMNVSERTVWGAIAVLERFGYLIVQARELGARTTDGRRVRGARGMANVYLLAYEEEQISATYNGRKLAEQCRRAWQDRSQKSAKETTSCDLTPPERSQNPALKVATDCDPTLKNLTQNHALARERLRGQIGDSAYSRWFKDAEVCDLTEEGVLRLSVRSTFIRDHIRDNYGEALISVRQTLHSRIERLEIVVRAKSTVRVAERAAIPSNKKAAQFDSALVEGTSDHQAEPFGAAAPFDVPDGRDDAGFTDITDSPFDDEPEGKVDLDELAGAAFVDITDNPYDDEVQGNSEIK